MGQGGWEETVLAPESGEWFVGWEFAKGRKLRQPRRAGESGPVHWPHRRGRREVAVVQLWLAAGGCWRVKEEMLINSVHLQKSWWTNLSEDWAMLISDWPAKGRAAQQVRVELGIPIFCGFPKLLPPAQCSPRSLQVCLPPKCCRVPQVPCRAGCHRQCQRVSWCRREGCTTARMSQHGHRPHATTATSNRVLFNS